MSEQQAVNEPQIGLAIRDGETWATCVQEGEGRRIVTEVRLDASLNPDAVLAGLGVDTTRDYAFPLTHEAEPTSEQCGQELWNLALSFARKFLGRKDRDARG